MKGPLTLAGRARCSEGAQRSVSRLVNRNQATWHGEQPSDIDNDPTVTITSGGALPRWLSHNEFRDSWRRLTEQQVSLLPSASSGVI